MCWIAADFYGKIDQLANKKKSPTTSPNTSPTSEPNYKRVHSTRAERLLPGYNNLSKPSSTKVDCCISFKCFQLRDARTEEGSLKPFLL